MPEPHIGSASSSLSVVAVATLQASPYLQSETWGRTPALPENPQTVDWPSPGESASVANKRAGQTEGVANRTTHFSMSGQVFARTTSKASASKLVL